MKKGIAFVLTIAIALGLMPMKPFSAETLSNNESENTANTPKVTAFATKADLMNVFEPNGEDSIIGKLVFGKNSSGNPQEWYILGKDNGVDGDNIAIFTTSHIAGQYKFSEDTSHKMYTYEANIGYGNSSGSIEVFSNHYGASVLRSTLNSIATNLSFFTSGEQELMQATTVVNKDVKNDLNYTTTDKLYSLTGDFSNRKYLWAGSDDSKVLPMSIYWSSGEYFWARSSFNSYYEAIGVDSGYVVTPYVTDIGKVIRPASNLNLSSVIFASAALSATSGTVVAETIADGTAMTLRLDGSSKNIGVALYDEEDEVILAKKNMGNGNSVALVVQGNDGTNDWYYSKVLTGIEYISKQSIEEAISLELNATTEINFEDCEIWLETKANDGLTYATTAISGDVTTGGISYKTYSSPDELMALFTPSTNNNIVGRIILGKDEEENALEWFVLGKDNGVAGKNIAIFAADNMAIDKMFEDNIIDNKIYDSGFGSYNINPSEVYPNHYGASDLRALMQELAANSDYFTLAEQSLMQATTVTTKDTLNSTDYTTSDVLYILDGEMSSQRKVWAGRNNDIELSLNTYWGCNTYFWLRNPSDTYNDEVVDAFMDDYVERKVNFAYSNLCPASNVNLTNVLFASAARAATSNNAEAGNIAANTAMTLRVDGSDKAIGNIIYNDSKKGLVATKDENATGAVSLVIQGNDGANDWYYSKLIGTTENIKLSDVETAVGLSSDLDLANCKVWLETTIDGVIYAVDNLLNPITVDNVEITIDAPVSKEPLDSVASTQTAGFTTNAPAVTWTVGNNTVTGAADYNTVYTANVTLVESYGANIANAVTATVNGEVATVISNADGSITVSYTFGRTAAGTINYIATGYEGTYDKSGDSIDVIVTDLTDVIISYSVDPGEDKNYSTDKPVFTDAGEYIVYYKIVKENYTTITGSKKVKIAKKSLSVSAISQTVQAGAGLDKSKYDVQGLVDGDKIAAVTFIPSTSDATDNGTISVRIDKIVNAEGRDVTANYDIAYTTGKLVIEEGLVVNPDLGNNNYVYIIAILMLVSGIVIVTIIKNNLKIKKGF